jgi:hypothetical protein
VTVFFPDHQLNTNTSEILWTVRRILAAAAMSLLCAVTAGCEPRAQLPEEQLLSSLNARGLQATLSTDKRQLFLTKTISSLNGNNTDMMLEVASLVKATAEALQVNWRPQ